MSPKKAEDLLKGWKPMSCKGQVRQIKAWFKNQNILSEDQKQKLAQGKDNSPVESPQASTSKNQPQQVPNKGKQTPKSNQKGKEKHKWKNLNHRAIESQRKRRQPWTMCSIWQER
ncbi:hypothetical protein O181_033053 [Austropuccinia psidii MF-1]|uniref:Uncharacterized protein n=1 Tax=Austropuccinia psidii MF-1 TaxID=1389203 RepID=A0A9Q3D0Q4_9BASI|nr:hypothetical protein [Austropuccinia psidii MF-1]